MSGICAAWRRDGHQRIGAIVGAVNAALASDAADGAFVLSHAEAGAGIGAQVRFAGQDVFEDAQLLLACDTDLINIDDLRRQAGPAVSTGTGAILAALYKRGGTGFLQQLHGGFAVVIWDKRDRRLVAAVDGFGIKRLAWYGTSELVAIATRADALRAATPPLATNPRAIANLLS